VTENPLDRHFRQFQRSRDPNALAAVFDGAAPRLLLVAMHLVRDAAAAEDLVQTVFLQAMRDVDSYDSARPVLPWLLGMLEHRASDLRRRAHRQREGAAADWNAIAGSREPSPERAANDRELRERLAEALAGMPGEYRDMLTLRLVHGLRAIEIAHAHGLAPTTVRTRLRRGLEALRKALPRGLGSMGLLALLGAELARAQDRLQQIRAHLLATAAAGTGVSHGFWVGLGTVLAAVLALGVWLAQPPASEPPPPPAEAPSQAIAALADPREGRPPGNPTSAAERQSATAAAAATDRTTRISGRVLDAASKLPLAMVQVAVRSYPCPQAGAPDYEHLDPSPVQSEADGRFVLEWIPDPHRNVELGFSSPTHVNHWHSFAPLRQGIVHDLGEVLLTAGTPVRLRLRCDDQPVGGVVCIAEHAPNGVGTGGGQYYPPSNHEGIVDLGVCRPGRWFYELQTGHAGHTGSLEVPLQPGPLEVPISLHNPPLQQSLSGVLRDTQGLPLAGIELAFPSAPGHRVQRTLSDSSFLFRLGDGSLGTPPPRLKLWNARDPWELVDDGGELAAGRHQLQLVARRRMPATLRLEVFDGDTGAPVEHFAVDCRFETPGRMGAIAHHPEGRATRTDLVPGTHCISVFPRLPYTEHADHLLELREGEQRTLRIALHPPAELTVTAVHATTGAPLPGIELALAKVIPPEAMSQIDVQRWRMELPLARHGYSGGSPPQTLVLARATTDTAGRARLAAPPDLRGLLLFAEGPHCIATLQRDIILPRGGGTATIAVTPAGLLRGQLGPPELLARYGPGAERLAAAAANAAIQRSDPSEYAEAWPFVELRAVGEPGRQYGSHTAADGSFRIGSVPAGRYEVFLRCQVQGNDRTHWSGTYGPLRTLELADGEAATLLLDAGDLLPGRARLRMFVDGEPWQGECGLLALHPAVRAAIRMVTAADGLVMTPWLPPGEFLPYVDIVHPAGRSERLWATARIAVPADGNLDTGIHLTRRRVVLDLQDAVGQPAAGRWLRLLAPDLPEPTVRAYAKVPADGRIVLDPAPPGPIQVLLYPIDGDPRETEARLVGEVSAAATSAKCTLSQ
jgi:RNA polymerase sigma-70 factor (ECF subfamily)